MVSDPPPWHPSKKTRILIGLATLWPPVYFVLFMVFVGGTFFWRNQGGRGVDLFGYIFPLHCFTMLLMFALTAVYIVHAFKSSQLRQDMRIVWIIILFMGNMFAFPVYWWLYLRPGVEPS